MSLMTNTATLNTSNKNTSNCSKLKYILRTKQDRQAETERQRDTERDRHRETETDTGRHTGREDTEIQRQREWWSSSL